MYRTMTKEPINKIRCIHFNIQSLRNKTDQLILEASGHDIICITETWLNKEIGNDQIHLPGYHPPLRKDRNEKIGGGVAIYVRDSYGIKTRPDLDVPEIEATWEK